MSIIEVKHLTKEYSLGTVTSIKDTLRYGLAKLSGKQTWHREKFKALDDVNFTIEEGEVVGIIGQNGAGKSTLLKHLASITTPTKGEVIVRGSIAPLIEVGAGVNPELTGRENIFLNGAILGIPKKVINQKLDEIIEFSELKQFIDTPVKRYSSGMTVRLGFSIATSMDADILIVDEVLAVGDLAFQRKCFDRMEELINGQGKTVLLVSHNIRQIQRLCSRVVLLGKGKIIADADPKFVCDKFYGQSDEKILLQKKTCRSLKGIQTSGDFELIDLDLLDDIGKSVKSVCHKGDVTISLHFRVLRPLTNATFGVGIHTTDFLYLTTHNSEQQLNIETLDPGEYVVNLKLRKIPLLPGVYSLRLGVTSGLAAGTIFYAENILPFLVKEGDEYLSAANRDGIFSLDAYWNQPQGCVKKIQSKSQLSGK